MAGKAPVPICDSPVSRLLPLRFDPLLHYLSGGIFNVPALACGIPQMWAVPAYRAQISHCHPKWDRISQEVGAAWGEHLPGSALRFYPLHPM